MNKGEVLHAVKKLKKDAIKPDVDVQGFLNFPILDWRTTEIGRQNWEVCHRMLVHDLVDLNIPEVNALLSFYQITILSNGAHTAALPRFAWSKPKGQPTVKGKARK